MQKNVNFLWQCTSRSLRIGMHTRFCTEFYMELSPIGLNLNNPVQARFIGRSSG